MENNKENKKGDNLEQQQQENQDKKQHPEELKGDGKRYQYEDLHVDDTVELLGTNHPEKKNLEKHKLDEKQDLDPEKSLKQ